MLLERTTACLGTTRTPTFRGTAYAQRTSTNRCHLAEFCVAQELVERLHICAEAMIVADEQSSVDALRGREAAFDTTCRKR